MIKHFLEINDREGRKKLKWVGQCFVSSHWARLDVTTPQLFCSGTVLSCSTTSPEVVVGASLIRRETAVTDVSQVRCARLDETSGRCTNTGNHRTLFMCACVTAMITVSGERCPFLPVPHCHLSLVKSLLGAFQRYSTARLLWPWILLSAYVQPLSKTGQCFI